MKPLEAAAQQVSMADPARDDPDVHLLRAMARGEAAALAELYSRHGPALLSYLTGALGERQLSEEVLQDVMLGAWKGASGFRGESSVRSWLLSIARKRAISALRRYPRKHAPLEEAEEVAAGGIDDRLEREEQQHDLRQAFGQLPDEQRETLLLVFYHELTMRDAAQVLGVAQGTIKSRLHRARAALKKLLGGEEAGDG